MAETCVPDKAVNCSVVKAATWVVDIAARASGAKACTCATLSALTCEVDKLLTWLVVSVVMLVDVLPELAVPPAAVLSAVTAAVMLPDTLDGLFGFVGMPSEATCDTDKPANWLLLKDATCSALKLLN